MWVINFSCRDESYKNWEFYEKDSKTLPIHVAHSLDWGTAFICWKDNKDNVYQQKKIF